MPLRMSRRGFVKGSALLLAVPADGSVGRPTENLTIDRLQSHRARLVAECEALDRRWLEAKARMPAHFLLGPKYRTAQGEPLGPRVGWPDVLSDAISLCNGLLLARPSPSDLRELFEADVRDHGRDIAVVNYRTRSRQLRDRLREARQLQSELGMPRTLDWCQLDEQIEAIDLLIPSASA